MSKPLPQAFYPCRHCADDRTWLATDLFWSEAEQDWVCDPCWAEAEPRWEHRHEPYGVSLQSEIKRQALDVSDE